MDYKDLQEIAKAIVHQAKTLNILSKTYWYTPESRKLKPKSKIGYYETKPTEFHFDHGCKLIIVFPRLAFDSLQGLINSYLPQEQKIAYRQDYCSPTDIGFDVYQRVNELKLFIEPDQVSSKGFTSEGMVKKNIYWIDCQKKALQDVYPPLSEQQVSNQVNEVSAHFKQALSYLESQANSKATLQVRRECGVRHRMVRVDLPGDQTKKAGFSDLVLVFGASRFLPEVILPKEPNPRRKPRSDSISAKYQANPSSFKYYDTFGIFEVYDK